MTFSVFDAAREAPSEPCIVTPDETLGFEQVAAHVAGALEWLSGQGVQARRERPVAFVAHNHFSTLCLVWACLEWRVPMLLLHPRWSPAECAALLALGKGTPREALLLSPPAAYERRSVQPSLLADPALPDASTDAERILAILSTSGTSGRPKAALLSRRAFVASATASALNLGWHAQDRWWLSLPLAHVSGLSIVLRCLQARKAVVLGVNARSSGNGASFDRLSSEELLALVQACRVTLLSLVPTQLGRLLEAGSWCPESLRAVLLGGAPANAGLLERARARGWPVLTTYGMTETASQITTQPPGDADARSVGLPLEGVEVRLDHGVVLVRSPTLLSGYYPEQPPPLDADGWFTTQDRGYVDEQGRLQLLGRADDVVITGGENVHPGEVERAFLEHAEVLEVAVVGLPDAEMGQIVAAALVTRTGELPRDLDAHLASRLASFKRPRRVALFERLPTGANGKLDRESLLLALQNADAIR